ncbi:MAG: alpha/beta hydrolase [Eubacteriales bacterium]|nr:alpha/beta hydrolase [Eubacteriales bacterium]
MPVLLIIALSIAGILALIAVISAILVITLILRKPVIDIANDRIVRMTQLKEYIPLLSESIARLNNMQKERIIRKSHDGHDLVAYFFPCENNPTSKKYAVLMHGYASCGKNDFAMGVEYFNGMGYNVLLPDHRAHGESGGKYISFGILERLDCKMWAEYLVERFGEDIKILLGGMSMGATTVLLTSELDLPHAVKGIYADCGFTEPIEELRHIAKSFLHVSGIPILIIAKIICKKLAGFDVTERSTIDALKNSKKPILFIHGKSDKLVPYRFSEQNYNACVSEKMLLVVDGGKHGTSFFTDSKGYKKKVEEFVSKYID